MCGRQVEALKDRSEETIDKYLQRIANPFPRLGPVKIYHTESWAERAKDSIDIIRQETILEETLVINQLVRKRVIAYEY